MSTQEAKDRVYPDMGRVRSVSDLHGLAEHHFKLQDEIKKLKIQDLELKKDVIQAIVRAEAWQLLSINWNYILPPRYRRHEK